MKKTSASVKNKLRLSSLRAIMMIGNRSLFRRNTILSISLISWTKRLLIVSCIMTRLPSFRRSKLTSMISWCARWSSQKTSWSPRLIWKHSIAKLKLRTYSCKEGWTKQMSSSDTQQLTMGWSSRNSRSFNSSLTSKSSSWDSASIHRSSSQKTQPRKPTRSRGSTWSCRVELGSCKLRSRTWR